MLQRQHGGEIMRFFGARKYLIFGRAPRLGEKWRSAEDVGVEGVAGDFQAAGEDLSLM